MLKQQPILKVSNLKKSFGGLQAICDLNFEVNAQEILGLIGPNGAGKSTSFDLITGMQRADKGDVELQGQRISHLKAHSIAQRGISRTFQKVRVFNSLSLEENVLIGALNGEVDVRKAREKAKEILELVELYDKKDLPVTSLTLVERKKTELARALSTSPKVMLLDEVMCGLNPQEMEIAIELVKNINKLGITIVIVEHVMRVIMSLAQRVVVLDYGVKIAEGTPQEIRNNPLVIKAYLGGVSQHA